MKGHYLSIVLTSQFLLFSVNGQTIDILYQKFLQQTGRKNSNTLTGNDVGSLDPTGNPNMYALFKQIMEWTSSNPSTAKTKNVPSNTRMETLASTQPKDSGNLATKSNYKSNQHTPSTNSKSVPSNQGTPPFPQQPSAGFTNPGKFSNVNNMAPNSMGQAPGGTNPIAGSSNPYPWGSNNAQNSNFQPTQQPPAKNPYPWDMNAQQNSNFQPTQQPPAKNPYPWGTNTQQHSKFEPTQQPPTKSHQQPPNMFSNKFGSTSQFSGQKKFQNANNPGTMKTSYPQNRGNPSNFNAIGNRNPLNIQNHGKPPNNFGPISSFQPQNMEAVDNFNNQFGKTVAQTEPRKAMSWQNSGQWQVPNTNGNSQIKQNQKFFQPPKPLWNVGTKPGSNASPKSQWANKVKKTLQTLLGTGANIGDMRALNKIWLSDKNIGPQNTPTKAWAPTENSGRSPLNLWNTGTNAGMQNHPTTPWANGGSGANQYINGNPSVTNPPVVAGGTNNQQQGQSFEAMFMKMAQQLFKGGNAPSNPGFNLPMSQRQSVPTTTPSPTTTPIPMVSNPSVLESFLPGVGSNMDVLNAAFKLLNGNLPGSNNPSSAGNPKVPTTKTQTPIGSGQGTQNNKPGASSVYPNGNVNAHGSSGTPTAIGTGEPANLLHLMVPLEYFVADPVTGALNIEKVEMVNPTVQVIRNEFNNAEIMIDKQTGRGRGVFALFGINTCYIGVNAENTQFLNSVQNMTKTTAPGQIVPNSPLTITAMEIEPVTFKAFKGISRKIANECEGSKMVYVKPLGIQGPLPPSVEQSCFEFAFGTYCVMSTLNQEQASGQPSAA